MKSLSVFVAILMALALFLGCAPKSAPTVTLTEEYTNQVYGISIKYQRDWVKQEGVTGTVVAFLSPKEGTSDIFQENLNIIVQDLSKSPMTLSEYTELSVNQIKQFITDPKIIESSSATLAGNPAQRLVYSGKQGQYTLKWLQVYAVKNNKAYLITYTAEVSKYPDFLRIIQEMINSFTID